MGQGGRIVQTQEAAGRTVDRQSGDHDVGLDGPVVGSNSMDTVMTPDGEIGTHRNQRMREREVSQRTPPFIEYGFITLCAGKSPVLFGQASLDFVFAMG